MGKAEEGIKDLQENLRDKPEYAEARLALADAFAHSGHLADAIAHYREYLRRTPRTPWRMSILPTAC